MEEKDIQMHEEASLHVWETSKWMKFIGVIMIIMTAFLFLGAIFLFVCSPMLNDSTNVPLWIFGILYLILCGINIFPIVYLMRACKAARAAAQDNHNEQMVEYLKNSKLYWKFIGILTIVMIAIYILIIPILVIATI